MGEGTNLLVKDGGIRGVVVALKNGRNPLYSRQLNSEEYRVGIFAGMKLPRLCSYALKNGLAGMNPMAGIPGSVGGGITMNCGTKHDSMKDVLTSVTALFSDGQVKTYPAENICFRYRNLDWKTTLENQDPELSAEKPVVLEGEFRLVSSDKERLKKEMKHLLKNRISKQPTNLASAGCFFKNLPDGVSAGKLIDQAGLKGLSNGDAQISAKHANFIVNKGNATASNILQLAETINTRVYKEFGVELIPEVQIVGT
jgi:UDP-N-acetylmuramate dehydrogenase